MYEIIGLSRLGYPVSPLHTRPLLKTNHRRESSSHMRRGQNTTVRLKKSLKQIEHFLEENNRELDEYKEILRSSPDAILITDPDVNIVYVNKAWENLTGYTLKEVIGKNPRILSSGKTNPEVYQNMWNHLKNNVPFTTEEVIDKRKDGKEYSIHTTFFPVKQNNKTIFYIQIQHDISERLKQEEIHKWFQALVNSSNDAIMSIDPNLMITSWNNAAERLYGYSEKEMIGKPLKTLVPKEYLQHFLHTFKGLNSQVFNYETKRLTKNGKLIDIATTASPIKDDSGELLGYSVIHRDISEKKRLEEMKKSFLSAVSHELKTPITTLKLLIQIHQQKLDKLVNKLHSESLDTKTIDRELNRLTSLINDLLDVSRFETGKVKLDLQEVDLSKLK